MDTDRKDDSGIRRRGRPRIRRSIPHEEPARCNAPQCQLEEGNTIVVLLPEELEVLRLIDLEGLEQEEAAAALGVSRRTVWKDLHEARKKVADALVHGKGLEVAGCMLRNKGRCPRQSTDICPKTNGGPCPRQWQRSGGCE